LLLGHAEPGHGAADPAECVPADRRPTGRPDGPDLGAKGDWAGTGTTLSQSLGNDDGFHVTFTAGDASLAPGDDDYGEYPYRVTLLSTGYAEDPQDSSRSATYQVKAVVRLVPRMLSDQPTDWSTMQQYTVYQSKSDHFELDIPCRLEGPARIQGKLKIARHYPNDDDAWWRYLEDLNTMRSGGYPDYRPFGGPVDLPFGIQDWADLHVLWAKLGVAVGDTAIQEAASDWTKPTDLATYQLYVGGPIYTIPASGNTLENVTLEPDPLTNPLGIFYCNGTVAIRANVTVHGSLFCKDDLRIEGTNAHFAPVELPALAGSDAPVRLASVSCRDFIVKPTAGGSLTGLAAVFDDFQIEKSPETVNFTVSGRLITRKFFIKERQPWETLNWGDCHDDFMDQLPVVPYFPVWMHNTQGRDPQPLLVIKPDAAQIAYHWHNWSDPIFVPHPDDDGLRWEIVQWTENP
jgi:hypothetical protein